MSTTAEAHATLRKRYGPVGRTLSRLIRPAICAKPGKVLVWGDWKAIEARKLPWLADSPGAEVKLDIFRETDADPSLPDVYQRQAGGILGKPALDVAKHERQSHGKVPELSLGFGGSNGALHSMARNYGVSFTDEEAASIVRGWRDTNTWACTFWDQLWEAALSAMQDPGGAYRAGRVTYLYERDYLNGTLVCELPCSRLLFYPSIRWREQEVKNKQTGKVETKNRLTYRRDRRYAAIWYGTLAENNTQASAGSILRRALTHLVMDLDWPVIGHTHDEIIGEVDEDRVEEEMAVLSEVMNRVEPWAGGLPLAADITHHWYYTKTLD